MIRLALPAVLPLRFAFSPIWEAIASARALLAGDRIVFSSRQIDSARASLGVSPMDALWDVLRPPSRYVPGFLVPAPGHPQTGIADDLAVVASTPPGRVTDELERAAALSNGSASALLHWSRRPDAYLEAVCAALDTYWRRVVEPDWPAHRNLLEAEVTSRGRQLALEGTGAVLRSIAERVTFVEGRLDIECDALDADSTIDGELVLVPTVHGWPKVFVGSSGAGLDIVYYPARGAATLLIDRHGSPEGELARLIGLTRARILGVLTESATTSELAGRLDLARGTVSVHLGRLAATGLANRSRVGRRVYYRLTERGEKLLDLFD